MNDSLSSSNPSPQFNLSSRWYISVVGSSLTTFSKASNRSRSSAVLPSSSAYTSMSDCIANETTLLCRTSSMMRWLGTCKNDAMSVNPSPSVAAVCVLLLPLAVFALPGSSTKCISTCKLNSEEDETRITATVLAVDPCILEATH